ncbi:class I SAM-dependent methyltransferase [Desemzia sp. FAM 23991]|uniref:class I SAM-dependent methyltransferase n=1 Tax=unclassified Desemzia TaxID=2685243 RepID=UPI00388A48DF
MSDHYYTSNPNAKSNIDSWKFTLRGHEFTFLTDSGVFSKATVDYGSRVLIETVDFSQLPEGDLLDLGCGYGPMGLSFAKEENERKVEMVDVNERAIGLAQQNALKNKVTNVDIHQSNIYGNVKGTEFAGVFSNPPIRAGKQVVHEILTGAYDYLKIGGALVIVIQKKQGAPSAKEKMNETFGNAEVIAKDKGYWIIQSVKE